MIEQFRNRLVGIIFLFVYAVVLAACPANSPITDSSSAADTTPTTASAATPVDETANLTSTVNSVESESATPANAGSAVTFTIVPEATEARFSIYELLMGRDKTVVGVTSAVEGSITVDPADPSSATISPIRIDASTLATDSGQRNGAIRRWILQSNQAAYQYIVFTPTAIEGLPTTITIGEPFEFTVVGDLTIRDITKEETFKLTVTATSEAELVGLGQTTVMRSDYNLTIPNVPSVANVGEEVPLEIEFTAVTG